jgi:hypothetical protein
MSTLAVPVRADLIAEIVLRSKGKADIASMIEHSVESFLDRTRGDPDIWSDEHAEAVASENTDDTPIRLGHPSKGYRWQGVFLPNGTILKINYKGEEKTAEVRHQQIYYEGSPCSPSQFASRVANNTSRNAWRDIWVKRPSDREWIFADTLRTGVTT